MSTQGKKLWTRRSSKLGGFLKEQDESYQSTTCHETFQHLERRKQGILCRSVISTPTAHTFFSCAVCQRSCPRLLSQFILQVVSHLVIGSAHTRASSTTWSLEHCVLPKSVHVTARHVIRHILDERLTFTWHMHSVFHSDTTNVCFFIFLWSSSRRDSTLRGLRQLERGSLADLPTPTGCEPKHLAETSISVKTSILPKTRILQNMRIFVSSH